MNQKILCEYIAGSHSYGLATKDSDIDMRGTYITTDLGSIINPDTADNGATQCTTNDTKDELYFEIRHMLNLLKKANTQSIEMLFNDKWTIITPAFKDVILHRKSLIDPERLYKSIRGYSFSEYKLATGIRTGKLGGKRQAAVAKYGFSPKNWINLLRLFYCAERFFEFGEFPVNLESAYIYPQLMEVKTRPERFIVSRLDEMYQEREQAFEASWVNHKDSITAEYKYDNELAAELMFNCYRDCLIKFSNLSLFKRLLYSLKIS